MNLYIFKVVSRYCDGATGVIAESSEEAKQILIQSDNHKEEYNKSKIDVNIYLDPETDDDNPTNGGLGPFWILEHIVPLLNPEKYTKEILFERWNYS